VVILKTQPENLARVVEAQKHALHVQLVRAQPGIMLLLAEIRPHGPALVRYGMRLKRHSGNAGQRRLSSACCAGDSGQEGRQEPLAAESFRA
jgi:hypothetical protein